MTQHPGWLALIVITVACGGACGGASRGTPAPAAARSLAAFDALAERLEAIGPFVVPEGGGPIACAAYTEPISQRVLELAGPVEAAERVRATAAAADLERWQAAHADRLAVMVEKIAAPLRRTVSCAAVRRDDAWHRVAGAVIALARPPRKPPVIAKLDRFDATTIDLLSKAADCAAAFPTLERMFEPLGAEYEQLSSVLKFVDDLVWEEERERLLQRNTHPCVREFMAYAFRRALEGNQPSAPP